MDKMDRRQFLVLLAVVILTIFVSIFFSFWFFVGSKRPQYEMPYQGVVPAQMNLNNDDAFKQIDNMMAQQQKDFDRMHKNFLSVGPGGFGNSSYGIKTEELDDAYRITINLKPFNNDPKNVKVDVNGNTVNISAKYEAKDKKGKVNSSQVSQSLTLPFEFDKNSVKQTQKGNSLVIEIPEKED